MSFNSRQRPRTGNFGSLIQSGIDSVQQNLESDRAVLAFLKSSPVEDVTIQSILEEELTRAQTDATIAQSEGTRAKTDRAKFETAADFPFVDLPERDKFIEEGGTAEEFNQLLREGVEAPVNRQVNAKLELERHKPPKALSPRDQKALNDIDPEFQRTKHISKFINVGISEDASLAELAALDELDPETQKRIAKYDTNLTKVLNNAQEIINQLSEEGMPQIGEARERFNQRVATLIIVYAELTNRGANFTDSEQALVGEMFGDPKSWTARVEDPAFLMDRLRIAMNATLRDFDLSLPGVMRADYQKILDSVDDPEIKAMVQGHLDPQVEVEFVGPDGNTKRGSIPKSRIEEARKKAAASGGTLNEL